MQRPSPTSAFARRKIGLVAGAAVFLGAVVGAKYAWDEFTGESERIKTPTVNAFRALAEKQHGTLAIGQTLTVSNKDLATPVEATYRGKALDVVENGSSRPAYCDIVQARTPATTFRAPGNYFFNFNCRAIRTSNSLQ